MGLMGLNAAYSIRSLKHAYDGSVVLDIRSLDIPAGQICIFTGPNGSGKTTFLSILALFQSPSGGTVRLNGIACTPDPDRALRRAVTLVHQKPVLFSTSVRNNLAYGLKAHGHDAGEIDRRLKSIEKEMRLSSVIEKHARKLSGGETQRVVLARALVLGTPILLLDEPTNSLDDAYRPVLVDLLLKANREKETTIIVATHDAHFIKSLGGQILRMDSGRILD
ncbi:MAG: ABC transporter ATP-binding protein [Acidobacteria bacterium]|nr:ABC transporter ATP-binding protein [Acidobacteriota bacterium]